MFSGALFPTDRRTNAFKLYDKARWSVGSAIASVAANKFLDWYNSRPSSAMPPRRMRRFARRRRVPRYGPRSRKTKYYRGLRLFRRSSPRKGYYRRVGRRLVAGPGPYQKRLGSMLGAPLDLRMSRNDYDSTRECINYTGGLFPTSVGPAIKTCNFGVGEMPLALSKLFDYDEYKITKIQMVLTPIFISNGAAKLEMNGEYDPYLYVIPRIHSDSLSSTPTLATVKSTPGVMRFHYLRKKPIVINLPAIGVISEDLTTFTTGTALSLEHPFRRVGWIHNPQDSAPYDDSKHPAYGNVVFYLPQIASGSFQPKWRIDYYATWIGRGNRSQIEI